MKKGLKTIRDSQDRLQSRLLVWVVGTVLTAFCLPLLLFSGVSHNEGPFVRMAFGVSFTFALLVWALKAGTRGAAFCGGIICLLVIAGTGAARKFPGSSGLTPMVTLFVLTFSATRLGKQEKELRGLAEDSTGRHASQVVANLGAAGLVVIAAYLRMFDIFSASGDPHGLSAYAGPAMVLAVFAEATADTVASEIGQAFGGRPILLTSLRTVEPGTDGAVSMLGTVAGILAAAIVVLSGVWSMHLGLRQSLAATTGGVAGLFFDSLLGATVERRGWLGNDLVNFSSTLFAASVALAILALR